MTGSNSGKTGDSGRNSASNSRGASSNANSASLIFDRRRQKAGYVSYARKKEYFDAVGNGDVNAIFALSDQNARYTTELFESSETYSDAMQRMHYDSQCAAAEMCLVAIQRGLPDMVACDVRDEFMKEFDRAKSLPDLYYLLHGMAYKLTAQVERFKRESSSSPKMRLMMSYIEGHLEERIALQDVAEAAELSRNYASALFKSEIGITMNEFILRERISEAKRLLEDGRLTVSEISSRLQFCSQSYFTQCFRRITGVTPKEYRTGV